MLASGAPHFTVDGIAVAMVGAPCTCEKTGHKHCKIATDDAGHTIDGMAVAYEGCLTTCSATLVATVPNFAKPDGQPAIKPCDFSRKMLVLLNKKGALMKNPAVSQIDILYAKYGHSKTIFRR